MLDLLTLAKGIHLEFADVGSLIFIVVCFVGLLAWMTYIAMTQRRVVREMVTREEMKEAFAKFKKELHGQ